MEGSKGIPSELVPGVPSVESQPQQNLPERGEGSEGSPAVTREPQYNDLPVPVTTQPVENQPIKQVIEEKGRDVPQLTQNSVETTSVSELEDDMSKVFEQEVDVGN